MNGQGSNLKVMFVKNSAGIQPTKNWIFNLPEKDCKKVLNDLSYTERNFSNRNKNIRSITGTKGLWEIRSKLPSGRNARIFFCVNRNRLIILHAFMKKTTKTPKNEIAVALSIMKGVLS